MIEKVKNFLKSPEKKVVLKNFFSLSILQGLNFVLPLLTYPYLIRVLGVDNMGLIFFANALINYFQVVTEYSFNMSATKDIALNVGDKNKLHEIFNDVLSTKIFLMVVSFILLSIILFTIPYFEEDRLIYFLTFGNVIGLCIFPSWFFQGIQKMKYITYINFCSKIIFTLAIFVFVREKQDVWLAPLFTACGYIVAGIVSIIYLTRYLRVPVKRQSFKRVKEQMKMGKYLFLSEFKITLFTNTNVLLLGFIAGNTAVGYLTSSEKLVRALGNLYTPFNLALFPYMSKEMHDNRENAYKSVMKISVIGSLLFIVCLTPVFIFAEEIVVLLFGSEMANCAIVVRILLFIPIGQFLENMFGKQILLNMGKDRLYFYVFLFATICNIGLNIFLTTYYSYKGTAIALTTTQIIINIGLYYYSQREIKKIKQLAY